MAIYSIHVQSSSKSKSKSKLARKFLVKTHGALKKCKDIHFGAQISRENARRFKIIQIYQFWRANQ
jgi:hypothetical protein